MRICSPFADGGIAFQNVDFSVLIQIGRWSYDKHGVFIVDPAERISKVNIFALGGNGVQQAIQSQVVRIVFGGPRFGPYSKLDGKTRALFGGNRKPRLGTGINGLPTMLPIGNVAGIGYGLRLGSRRRIGTKLAVIVELPDFISVFRPLNPVRRRIRNLRPRKRVGTVLVLGNGQCRRRIEFRPTKHRGGLRARIRRLHR